jgi:choline dehydrogenase-like flavoprotein
LSTDTDVCIVGAGAGGAVAAWALARRGVRVLLLERGPRFAASDYETHSPDWEIRPSPLDAFCDAPDQRSYESAPGQLLDPQYRHLSSRSPTAFAAPAPGRRRSFYYSRSLGVGGSTLHYQAEAHRFPDHALRMRRERGVAADWPLGPGELAPFYQRVEELLQVAGDPANPFKAPRGPYPHPPHPLSAASQRLGAGAAKLGWHLLPNPLAILPVAQGNRAACHYCNGCVRGCDVAAKSSVDVAVLPDAEATGRLRVVTRFQAARLEHAADGRITAVVGFDAEGREARHEARAFVLAAGAVETPRLLLASAGGAHPDGVGNARDQVGRHFMETLFVQCTAYFEEPLQTWAGIPIEARVWDWNGLERRDDFPAGFVLGQFAGELEGPAGNALEGIEGFGRRHREALRRRFGAGTTLFGIAEQLPRPENRVSLSRETDARGVPLARIEVALDALDLETLSRMHARILELADATGIREVVGQTTAYDTPLATHVGGSCRMGHDPASSVVDAFGAVHGVANLVIADASVLVTQGAGDSPSLTIQALALRAAEALADRARRGEVSR